MIRIRSLFDPRQGCPPTRHAARGVATVSVKKRRAAFSRRFCRGRGIKVRCTNILRTDVAANGAPRSLTGLPPLLAQLHSVLTDRLFLNGGNWKLAEEFVEVESGKRNNRPKLAAALAACKRLKARLVVAKLDRLARNVAFISKLMESGVEFVAADMPFANS